MRPIINLDELEYTLHEKGSFQAQLGDIALKIGAKKLGYNLTILSPGKKAWPFHNHHTSEEMFFILEGQGMLRYGDKEYLIKKHDVIAAPAGGRSTAHQIMNTGEIDLKYLALSTTEKIEACEYPDSNKIQVTVGEDWNNLDLLHVAKSDQGVDYWEGEMS